MGVIGIGIGITLVFFVDIKKIARALARERGINKGLGGLEPVFRPTTIPAFNTYGLKK